MAVETLVITDKCKIWALEQSPSSPQKALINAIEFVAGRGIKPGEPMLVLQGEALKRLGKALGKSFDSPHNLCEAVESVTKVPIGEVPVNVSPGQRRVLEGRARDNRTTPEAELEMIVQTAVHDKLGW